MTTEEAVNRLARTVLDLQSAVDQFRTGLELAEERTAAAEARVAVLTATVVDQTGLIRQLTNGSATTAAAIGELGERLDRNVAGLVERFEARLVEADREFTAAVTRAETAVGEIATDVANSARATAALVSTLTNQLPKSLLIDHAGDLIATLHNGDAITVGPVRGPAGRDAPRIADAIVSKGHLVMKMSDGTSVLAAMPEPVSATVPASPATAARTPAGDRIKDEIRMGVLMDRSTDSFTAIGKKYGLTARVVSRIIRDYKA